MPFKGPAKCIRTLCESKRASSCISRKLGHWTSGLSFTHVPSHWHCKIPGHERADELAAHGKANLRCTVGRFESCGPPGSARPETSKDPSCSEIEVIIRDFESGPGVFADDGAFAFGARRDIELGARILYDHCVRWGMMPHTAGKDCCNVLWATSG